MKLSLPLNAAFVSVLFLLLLTTSAGAQQRSKRKKAPQGTAAVYDTTLYNGLRWRSIGPYRGGRAGTATGVPGNPNLYYMGTAGGGVWRTTDGGGTWDNISDRYFGGSVGAVAVSESDPNVLYAGEGEQTVRGNVSSGFGVWKSQDAGQTWVNVGLKDSRHIGRIRIHPKNPDLVYVAAMGDLYAPSEMRGVYRSKDGGKNWERVLFANKDAGAVDLLLDPSNPRILYASTWNVRRTPYSFSSGGPGSGLWKSTDGGDTWQDISRNEGLPAGTLGIIGVAVSPVNSSRVWALVEAEKGGLFRSDDGGKNWQKLSDDRNLRQRAWYYTRIYADPKDADVMYVLNVSYHKSKDGGRTFQANDAPHGDHHDLWIAPENPNRMVMADDGGAQVSTDGGLNWTTYYNQPTGQFYRVVTDNHFPYRIYGAQQDNSTVRIPHRTGGRSIEERDWESTAGGESAHLAVDPINPDIVYGGSYDGFLSRVNHGTQQERTINVWPDNPMGHGAEGMKYRFQWNFPLLFSSHDPKKLYAGSNHLHATTNEGQSWEIISPDLTRNDPKTLGPSGGPITKDNTAVEYYGTIFAIAESPAEQGVIWTGSDDGLLHVTRDNGKTWTKVLPKGMPDWIQINSIDAHPTNKGAAYVAATMYKSGDFWPYLYKTTDYGKTWTKITTGIPDTHFTRVVRADPKRPGLLYAGTEYGMYVSFNDGKQWQPFQLNLPPVSITDLTIKNNNLIAATQGRGFWLLDDITPLHQLSAPVAASKFHLYTPTATYKMDGRGTPTIPKTAGQNHPGGVMLYYHLAQKQDSTSKVKLEILDSSGKLIRTFANTDRDLGGKNLTKGEKAKVKRELLPTRKGLNRYVWDLSYPDASQFEGLILWGGGTQGPRAVPGTYKARLTLNQETQETTFTVLPDPRSKATPQDLQAQFDFLQEVQRKLTETHDAIRDIRTIRGQLNTITGPLKDQANAKDIVESAAAINKKMTQIEEALYQTKNKSDQDPLNFPIRLNNKLANLVSQASTGDYRPTEQAVAFKKEVTEQINQQLSQFKMLKEQDIPALNKLIRVKSVDAIMLPQPAPPVAPSSM
ncbi:glycosyl hydrolase BNR repeat-containing protein [Hymenobacter roseosalivarius DSM 11622]|uniref:Glycosyl hydrolase BNR repeat-containing protein n=1 Tax=Hymenobacter roseosalivarius DSM 11622 TaxID=645990 RepID=A0A1W1VZ63_9BACT|nr:glycosyl hydrolase [Hymenobacter roseosalivarius]SMB98672.1 glycosyl hydrolase BNR repeat-containing protein [Hymenobacter roseosalivarius DSM 11622]